MALGKRKNEQQGLWIATTELPKSPGHPFFQKLNDVLAEAQFDRWIEKRCEQYYATKIGRPSIPPGVYFRMILVGYFEGIASQRGIAWRCSDSRSLAEFLGVPADKETPDHSSMSRVHERLPLEVHEEMFVFVLKIAAEKKLLHGKTAAVDSTTLEANAAMKSLERNDSGEDYQAYLTRLAAEAGIENPTDEDLRRFDKKRAGKKLSNEEWESTTDPDSRIAKMVTVHEAPDVLGAKSRDARSRSFPAIVRNQVQKAGASLSAYPLLTRFQSQPWGLDLFLQHRQIALRPCTQSFRSPSTLPAKKD